MKKLIIILFASIGISLNVQAQIKVDSVRLDRYPSPKLYMRLSNFGLTSSDTIAISRTLDSLNKNSPVSIYDDKGPLFGSKKKNVKIQYLVEESAITILIDGLTDSTMVELQSKQNEAYLYVPAPLGIEYYNTGPLNTLKVSKDDVKNGTLGKINITKALSGAYFEAMGGEFAFAQNYFHWGYTPASQSDNSKLELNADFSFRKTYGKSNLIFFTKGRVSTTPEDSLNHLYIYPVNFKIHSKPGLEIMGQLGNESNQTFSSGRIAANFSLQTLLPNFIDLTMGSTRFRLKPILNLGLKGYQEYDNLRGEDNEFSFQANASLYYSIPLFDYYNIIFESTAYYDFNSNINPEENIKFNYSLTLSANIPNTPIQTVFKYRDGQVDVNNLSGDSVVTIGLLANVESLLLGNRK